MYDDIDNHTMYSNSDIPPPINEYWAARRRVAAASRNLHERLQTTDIPVDELTTLADNLEQQLDLLTETPKLHGRNAWVAAEKFGGYGVLQLEATPIFGNSNPISPVMSIWFDEGKAFGSVTLGYLYEGNDGIAHGGWVAALFDEFLGTAQVLSGRAGMTATLKTRYHRPTPLNQRLTLEGYVKAVEGRRITLRGKMFAEGKKVASCEGLFVAKEGLGY